MRIGIYCSSLENLTKRQKEMVDILISEGHTVERLDDVKINGKGFDQVWIDECSDPALNTEQEFYEIFVSPELYQSLMTKSGEYVHAGIFVKTKKITQPYFRQNQRW